MSAICPFYMPKRSVIPTIEDVLVGFLFYINLCFFLCSTMFQLISNSSYGQTAKHLKFLFKHKPCARIERWILGFQKFQVSIWATFTFGHLGEDAGECAHKQIRAATLEKNLLFYIILLYYFIKLFCYFQESRSTKISA